MSVVVFHPSTAPFVQQAARAVHEAGWLDRFYTAVRNDPASVWQRVACASAATIGRDLRRQLARRSVTEVPPALVTSYPIRELIRLAVGAVDRGGRVTDLVWEWAEPGFDRKVARQLRPGLRGVYGFEYSSLATFQQARALGLKAIYDVPAPEPVFVQEMLNREIAAFPELHTPYHAHTEKREARRIARRRAEWHAADLVIAASEFTKATYVAAGLEGSRVRIVPYGAPPAAGRDEALRAPKNPAEPLTFLWAGTFSIRKGAHYLLEAWRQGALGRHARLKIFGAVALPERLLRPLPDGVVFGGSIPRAELMDEYRAADALIFPTLCDGFGLVVTEAWSRGLPVITTDRAGAADLLKPGQNGLRIRAADAAAIREALEWCLTHRGELSAMREAALTAAAGWQWHDYRRALAEAIRPTLGL